MGLGIALPDNIAVRLNDILEEIFDPYAPQNPILKCVDKYWDGKAAEKFCRVVRQPQQNETQDVSLLWV